MKVVFATDSKFVKLKNNEIYSTGSLSYDVWKRYLSVFNELVVLSRFKDKDSVKNASKLNKSDGPNVSFVKIPDLTALSNLFTKYNYTVKLLEKNISNSDAIIARLPSITGSLAVAIAKKLNKPYLIELVGCPWDSLWNYSIKGKLLAPIMYIYTKQIIKSAKFVIYVTNEFLQKRYPNHNNNVNCSDVSLEDFDENILKQRIEKINNIGDKIKIGTIAAVDVKYKGQEDVIKALGVLKKKGIDNFEYELVGGGDQSYLLSIAKKYNVRNQIRFLGSMPHKQVFEWLDSIDIYVQPSKQEGLPRALIEAMSRGLPCFGAKTGGIPELLDNEYIYRNNKNSLKRICEILLSFDREKMIEQSVRNFCEAKKYEREKIEKRRNVFLKNFASYVISEYR